MRKCPHSVYWPDGDPVALSCQSCNPDGTGVGPVPVLPRSSSDPLNAIKTEKAETCEHCGCVRTFSSNACLVCGTAFPIDGKRGVVQGTANTHTAGMCPHCGSTVHFDLGKQWQCADCDAKFPAPKRQIH